MSKIAKELTTKTAKELRLVVKEIKEHQTRKNHVNPDLSYCIPCEKRVSFKQAIINFKNELKEIIKKHYDKGNTPKDAMNEILDLIQEIEEVENEKN